MASGARRAHVVGEHGGGGQLRPVCLEREVRGQEPLAGGGQSGSRGSRSRLEGPSSGGEANLFHLAEQRPE